MTASQLRAYLRKTLHAALWTFRLVVITTTTMVGLGVLNVLVHTCLHVCPLHLARFEARAIVPVVYGLPLGGEMFDKAARGEIELGGCVRGPLDGVCPYCHWPAAFGHDPVPEAE